MVKNASHIEDFFRLEHGIDLSSSTPLMRKMLVEKHQKDYQTWNLKRKLRLAINVEGAFKRLRGKPRELLAERIKLLSSNAVRKHFAIDSELKKLMGELESLITEETIKKIQEELMPSFFKKNRKPSPNQFKGFIQGIRRDLSKGAFGFPINLNYFPILSELLEVSVKVFTENHKRAIAENKRRAQKRHGLVAELKDIRRRAHSATEAELAKLKVELEDIALSYEREQYEDEVLLGLIVKTENVLKGKRSSGGHRRASIMLLSELNAEIRDLKRDLDK
jgi:hypothetical protein